MKINYLYIILFLCCCNTKNNKNNNTVKSFEKKVYSIIDSINRNHMKSSNLYIITHERNAKNDYFKISTAEYFNFDSISYYKKYKDNIIIYYSTNFYNKKAIKDDIVDNNLLKGFIHKNESTAIFHPTYVIIKNTKTDFFAQVSLDEQNKLNLFNFNDINISQDEYKKPK